MEASKSTRTGGWYCVAGTSQQRSCKNTSYTKGIRMHSFPKDAETRQKWVKFVQRHRLDFKEPTQHSSLCSAHFDESCYSRQFSEDQSRYKVLQRGSIPTKDTSFPEATPKPLTDREKRKMLRDVLELTGTRPCKSTKVEEPTSETTSELDSKQNTEDKNEEKSDGSGLEESLASETYTNINIEPLPMQSTVSTQTAPSVDYKVKYYQKLNECKVLRRKISRIKNKRSHNLEVSSSNLSQDTLDDQSDVTYEHEEKVEEINANQECHHPEVMTDSECESSFEDDMSYEPVSSEDCNWSSDDDDDVYSEEEEYDSKTIKVAVGTPNYKEPSFLVFYSMLVQIFTLCCFKCKSDNPKITIKQNGTMATISQHCHNCGKNSFVWQSQPLVLGHYALGNVLLSFGILIAGASVKKVLLICQHMGLCVYSIRTFFAHQRKFLFPLILTYWIQYQQNLLSQIRKLKEPTWSGDGRFDSMGHSAKYGTYSMFSNDLSKIVHFEVVQSNETGGSTRMELEGAKRCFSFIQEHAKLHIPVFISDRHSAISKWIREEQPNTKQFYDIWHVAKTVTKRVIKASKKTGCEVLKLWLKAIKNHLYWCVTSTKRGFETMIEAKWMSLIRHVSNKHSDHPNELFPNCTHEDLEPREWILPGTEAFDTLNQLVSDTRLVKDIKKMSPETQTSSLESYHAVLNFWHPKMLCFSWMGSKCRQILASLHFNENVHRDIKKKKNGDATTRVWWPKFKAGEALVKKVKVEATYGYANSLKEMLFDANLEELEKVYEEESAKTPPPLTAQFTERLTREQATQQVSSAAVSSTPMVPSIDIQEQLLVQEKQRSVTTPQSSAPKKISNPKKTPCCHKCKQPMKGHSRGSCK